MHSQTNGSGTFGSSLPRQQKKYPLGERAILFIKFKISPGYDTRIEQGCHTTSHIVDINNRLNIIVKRIDSIFEYMMCRLNYQGHG